MRTITIRMNASLDGVVSHIEQWGNITDEMIKAGHDYYDTLEAAIYGGRTYTPLAEYWQNAELNSKSATERAFAKKLNDTPKIMIGRSEREMVWRNSTQIITPDDESFVREIKKLKEGGNGNISVDSGEGAWQLFLRTGVWDEMRFFVQPVIVGKGSKLFDVMDSQVKLERIGARTFDNGVTELHFRKK